MFYCNILLSDSSQFYLIRCQLSRERKCLLLPFLSITQQLFTSTLLSPQLRLKIIQLLRCQNILSCISFSLYGLALQGFIVKSKGLAIQLLEWLSGVRKMLL